MRTHAETRSWERDVTVDVRSAAVARGGTTIWHDLDVRARAGDLVAILGPNGAGKSTLLHALLALQPLTAGSIEVLGRAPRAARREVGYLPQRRSFAAGTPLRGVDVVRLALDATTWTPPIPLSRRSRQARATATEQVAAAVERVGAQRYASQPIGAMSGGQQQRLLLAQALVRGPRLLLLDEPLDSLDVENQYLVAELLAQLCDDGVTVLLVTHDLAPVAPHTSTVVYLANGTAAVGTPDEVLTSERLSELHGVAVEVLRTADGRPVIVGQAVHDRHDHH